MSFDKMKPFNDIISEALKVLKEGGLILYPTDTVWGIGCDAADPVAVSKIYDIKKRSDSKALVLLASDLDMVAKYVKEIPEMAIHLVEANDRPMTIIYPGAIVGKKPSAGELPAANKHFLAYNAVAEDGSVGIRIPMMEFCRNLAYKLGRPLVSTSANISGEPAPKAYSEISETILRSVDYVVAPALESGATGVSSQIIKLGLDEAVEIIRA